MTNTILQRTILTRSGEGKKVIELPDNGKLKKEKMAAALMIQEIDVYFGL